MLLSVLILFVFFLSPRVADAALLINEFSSSTTSDWVELINMGTEELDLSEYLIMDEDNNKVSNMSGVLEAGEIISFGFSNRLNNAGDIVRLYYVGSDTKELVDEIPYGRPGQVCLPSVEGSIGRYPDGSSTIERFEVHTRDLSNDDAKLAPCPTPTPIPTNTQSPTSIPTPVPTTIPTATPVPTNTPLPTESQVQEDGNVFGQASENRDNVDILGIREEIQKDVSVDDEIDEEGGTANFIYAGLMIFGGLSFMGAGVYPAARKLLEKRRKNLFGDNNPD